MQAISPSNIMATSSDTCSAKSKSCVAMMTVPPAFAWSRRARAMMRRLAKSKPLVGSSSSSSSGPINSSFANASSWR